VQRQTEKLVGKQKGVVPIEIRLIRPVDLGIMAATTGK
jgi:hypothetical protein